MPRFVVVPLDSRLWQRLAGDGLRSVESTDRRIRRLETRASRRTHRHSSRFLPPADDGVRASECACVRAPAFVRACVRFLRACACVCARARQVLDLCIYGCYKMTDEGLIGFKRQAPFPAAPARAHAARAHKWTA